MMRNPMTKIKGWGQVARMSIPAGWVEERVKYEPFDLRCMRKFHPAGSGNPRLCLFYRGHPMGSDSGSNFMRILEQPAHELSGEEMESIQEALRDAVLEGAMQRLAARTQDWNGRRVLIVEGRWKESQWDSFTILANAGDRGCMVQEVYYAAPKADFVRHVSPAMKALLSIEWAPPGEDLAPLHQAEDLADRQ